MRTASKTRPHVILIITDDQGYGDLACHGNPLIRTPNMDRLHGESVRLTNCHVGPTCAPTRAALLTGRYCNSAGVWHTIMGRSLLRDNEITLADVFLENGYSTGFFGKWHLGDNYPFRPEDRGFQEVVRHGGGGVTQAPDIWGNNYFDDAYYHNGKPQRYEGYCTDVWFDNAIRFIQQNKNRPFFCYLATNAPHSPFNVSRQYSRLYDENDAVPNANFYGMITNIDDNIARLEKALQQLDLRDDTIFIFMTDNGTAAGFRNGQGFNAGMRGTKGSEYDGGHRVPFFIRWPNGNLQGGRDIERLTAHIDVMPTLIDLCGLRPPADAVFDGASLKALLSQSGLDWPNRVLVTDSQRVDHPVKWRKSAVMTDRWRLVNRDELYDMTSDPGQKNDAAAQHPDVVAWLREEYEKWWERVSKDFDDYCEIIIGSDHENPTCIVSHDWHGESVPWNQQQIRSGMTGNGFWAVEIARDGKYEFQLRRWPIEEDMPINSSIPASSPVPGGFQYPAGKEIRVTQARLKIADLDITIPVKRYDKAAIFIMELKAGKTFLQTWFSDDENQSRGAYYVYAKRL
ncbi:MAG: arylsulfatase [Candidatus Omnitrophica bacterium]|nr:arylsulfatase [Candidatus Omnitrophota bacterium]